MFDNDKRIAIVGLMVGKCGLPNYTSQANLRGISAKLTGQSPYEMEHIIPTEESVV